LDVVAFDSLIEAGKNNLGGGTADTGFL